MSSELHRRNLESLVGKEFSPLIEQCVRRNDNEKRSVLESIEDALNAAAQKGVSEDTLEMARHLKLAYLYGRKIGR